MSRPRKRWRDVDGVFLLDKPQGMSSNDIMQKVKLFISSEQSWAYWRARSVGNGDVADLLG